MNPLFPEIPEDFEALDDEALTEFITQAEMARDAIVGNVAEYVGEGRTKDELVAEFGEGIEALKAAKVERAARADVEVEADEADDELAATVAELAAETDDADEEGDAEADEATADEAAAADPEVETEAAATIVAAAKPKARTRLPRPARSIAAAPQEAAPTPIAMTASAGGLGPDLGEPVDPIEVARMTIKKRSQFGQIPRGTKGEKISIAQFDTRDEYPEDRRLSTDAYSNQDKIDQVQNERAIRQAFDIRREGSLVASGGLCAPVTPYYNLQMLSVPDRPVRAALPAFQADRGGINAAQPLSLADITTAVGIKTAAQDAAGGSSAEKTCQIVDCPDFVITDVEIVYHCVQFGNLGARAYPERVAQANSLVLAAHARTAESQLLTNIAALSTAVTAASTGLGVTASLLGEILAAANGMRNRHRMNPEAVLRIMLPDWSVDLMVSDVIRGQFDRFGTTEESVTALLRSFDLEPTFYIDGAAGASQVFGAQNAGALLAFPPTVVWYLFPEGSFLYLDAGTLELGIVRDSVLNKTNDFQIFGESFENVAFVGVESIQVTSTVCDSGAVSLPIAYTECGDYGIS